jgi:hypothetical protein
MLKTAFDDNAMGKTQTFEWFSRFRRGKNLVEVCEHLGHPSTGHTNENVEKVRKIINKVRQNSFGGSWHVRPLIWNKPTNSNGGLEHAANLHRVFVSVAH